MPLRLIFFGTADISRPILRQLCAQPDWTVAAVVTQPDRPRGRELKLQPTGVKIDALECGIPVLQPARARDPEFIDAVRTLAPDLAIVVAYGQILPRTLLDVPTHGCLNVHTSLLPKYRGAAPIQWAVINGDAETGVTIMRMDEGLDTGDIISQRVIPIESHDTAGTLHGRLAAVGAELLVETVPGYLSGAIPPRKQPDTGASYARKIAKEDGRIDWNLAARDIWNRVRGLDPWPGSYTYLWAGRPVLIKVHAVVPGDAGQAADRTGDCLPGAILAAGRDGIDVCCGAGFVRVLELQREGARRLRAAEFMAGFPLKAGQRFQSEIPGTAGSTTG